MSRARSTAVLHSSRFRFFLLSSSASDIALNMWFLVTAWVVLELSGSAVWVGLVLGISAVPALCLSLFGGALIDRAGKFDYLKIGRGGFFVVIVATASLAALGILSELWLLVLSLLIGILWSVERSAARSALGDLVPAESVAAGNALHDLSEYGGEIVAPLFIAIVLATSDTDTVYWTASAAMGLACLLLLPLRTGSRGRKSRLRVGVVQEILDGLLYVRRTSPYPALLAVSISLVASGMLAPLLPVFSRDVIDGGGSTFAVLASAYAIGLVTGSLGLAFVANVVSRSRLLLLSQVAAGTSIALVAVTTSPIGACALLFVAGMGLSIGGSLVSTLFLTHARHGMKGRVMSVFTMIEALIPLMAIVGGATAAILGVEQALILAGLAIGSATVLAFVKWPDLKHLD